MLRTALTSVAITVLAAASASWLTDGFEVWTAEGARRRAVAIAPVVAPQATLLGMGAGDGVTGQSLYGLLTRPGRVTIVSFIYTRCPGICRSLGSSFQQLQEAVFVPKLPGADGRAHDGIGLLSISFDSVHDDAIALERYARLWQVNPYHWLLASVPDGRQLQQLLKAWQVVVVADGRGGWEHNAALLVVDERGRLVRIFDDADGPAALDFARALQRQQHTGPRL